MLLITFNIYVMNIGSDTRWIVDLDSLQPFWFGHLFFPFQSND